MLANVGFGAWPAGLIGARDADALHRPVQDRRSTTVAPRPTGPGQNGDQSGREPRRVWLCWPAHCSTEPSTPCSAAPPIAAPMR